MTVYDVSRTLVKSQPEVWAELEKTERLAELFGDDAITITRAEPESKIEWKGSNAEGTIEISGSGWGTKVRLTAEMPAVIPPEREPVEEVAVEEVVTEEVAAEIEFDEPIESIETSAEPKPKLFARFKAIFSSKAEEVVEDVPDPAEVEPELVSEPEPEPEPVPEPVAETPAIEEPDFEARLTSVLDHLGSAHKRPFVNAG